MLTVPQGGSIIIRKRSLPIRLSGEAHNAEGVRYSEFDDLRRKLLMTFPNCGGAMPPLPPKSLFCEPQALVQIFTSGLTVGKINSALLSWRKGGLAWHTS